MCYLSKKTKLAHCSAGDAKLRIPPRCRGEWELISPTPAAPAAPRRRWSPSSPQQLLRLGHRAHSGGGPHIRGGAGLRPDPAPRPASALPLPPPPPGLRRRPSRPARAKTRTRAPAASALPPGTRQPAGQLTSPGRSRAADSAAPPSRLPHKAARAVAPPPTPPSVRRRSGAARPLPREGRLL